MNDVRRKHYETNGELWLEYLDKALEKAWIESLRAINASIDAERANQNFAMQGLDNGVDILDKTLDKI